MTPPEVPPLFASFRNVVTDAIAYWEPRRVLYYAVLAAIVAGYYIANLPGSQSRISFDGLLVLFVLANVCYCAAYIADLFAQFSGFQALWRRIRGLLLVLGLFAGIITRYFAIGFFQAM